MTLKELGPLKSRLQVLEADENARTTPPILRSLRPPPTDRLRSRCPQPASCRLALLVAPGAVHQRFHGSAGLVALEEHACQLLGDRQLDLVLRG